LPIIVRSEKNDAATNFKSGVMVKTMTRVPSRRTERCYTITMIFVIISGGFSGLIVGAAIGSAAAWGFKKTIIGNLRIGQTQLMDSTFSIMGALCQYVSATRGRGPLVQSFLQLQCMGVAVSAGVRFDHYGPIS
jgi:hypothetical protein